MPSSLIRRAAAPSDLDGLVELDARCFDAGERWNADSWRAELTQPDRWVQLVLDGDQLLGAASFLIGDDLAELLKVLIAPEHRGGGLGADLVGAGIAHAAGLGLERMLLEVRHDNPARRLYERLGFSVIHTRPNYYGAGADALVMELALPAARSNEDRKRPQ